MDGGGEALAKWRHAGITQSPETMDDPGQASRLASMTAHLLRANVPRTCVFKFSQVTTPLPRPPPQLQSLNPLTDGITVRCPEHFSIGNIDDAVIVLHKCIPLPSPPRTVRMPFASGRRLYEPVRALLGSSG